MTTLTHNEAVEHVFATDLLEQVHARLVVEGLLRNLNKATLLRLRRLLSKILYSVNKQIEKR